MTTLQLKEFASVVSDCATHSMEALKTVNKLNESLKSKNQKREGIGLLEVKNRELLAYMLEMTNFMDRMGAGQSVAGSEGFLRAALHRTVLERIKPIEQKLSTQIDKLIKLSEGQEVVADLVPRIDDMEFEDEEKKVEDDNEEKEDMYGKKKYMAPRLSAMHYFEEDGADRNEKQAKRRALHSSLIKELKQQYSSAPEEYREISEGKAKKLKEIEKYEEDNYKRLVFSSKIEKKKRHREKNVSALEGLLDFGAYMVRDDGPKKKNKFQELQGKFSKSKKRKTGGGKGKPKKSRR